jgi:hypothetical protein
VLIESDLEIHDRAEPVLPVVVHFVGGELGECHPASALRHRQPAGRPLKAFLQPRILSATSLRACHPIPYRRSAMEVTGSLGDPILGKRFSSMDSIGSARQPNGS